MSRVEQINKVLRALQSGTPDVEAAALISEDGLTIASALPQHMDEMRVGGMSATLHILGTKAAIELERGKPEEVLVRGRDGYVVMRAASQGTLLLLMAGKDAKLGLIFMDMARAISELKKLL